MNFKIVLKNLLSRFSEAGVDVALSGGLALSTMGIFRFTRDVDFVILEECEDHAPGAGRPEFGVLRKKQGGKWSNTVFFVNRHYTILGLHSFFRSQDFIL